MPTLDCISFNTSGWTPEEATEDMIAWSNEAGDRLEYHIFATPPALPVLYPVEGFQKFASDNWQDAETALIYADVLSVRGTSVVRAILKQKLDRHSQIYLGRIHLPFRDFGYEIRLATIPHPTPSIRETEISDELILNLDEPVRWLRDPYTPDRPGDYLCCESDAEEYDSRYPDDPLTLLRQEMVKIIASIQTVREVRNSIPFQGNA